jgi:hypothetical protein
MAALRNQKRKKKQGTVRKRIMKTNKRKIGLELLLLFLFIGCKTNRIQECTNDLVQTIREHNGVIGDEECLIYLFDRGVEAFPEIFRVWVETKYYPEILLKWEWYLRERKVQIQRGLIKQLDEDMTTDQGLDEGIDIYVSTKGTNFQGHAIAIINPILPYEKVFGDGSWPKDLPLERLKDPQGWEKDE